ncbi:MAG: cupin domain-containing protein [Solirubrobacteraceae bacterium]
MPDPGTTFATIDRDTAGRFQLLRRELGVSSFGINLIALRPRERGRIHAHAHQEEVFLVLEGELTLLVEGSPYVLGSDRLVRIAADVRRQLVNAGPERLLVLALGGAGIHDGRDGIAWQSFDDHGPGRRPGLEMPLPADLPPDSRKDETPLRTKARLGDA